MRGWAHWLRLGAGASKKPPRRWTEANRCMTPFFRSFKPKNVPSYLLYGKNAPTLIKSRGVVIGRILHGASWCQIRKLNSYFCQVSSRLDVVRQPRTMNKFHPTSQRFVYTSVNCEKGAAYTKKRKQRLRIEGKMNEGRLENVTLTFIDARLREIPAATCSFPAHTPMLLNSRTVN